MQKGRCAASFSLPYKLRSLQHWSNIFQADIPWASAGMATVAVWKQCGCLLGDNLRISVLQFLALCKWPISNSGKKNHHLLNMCVNFFYHPSAPLFAHLHEQSHSQKVRKGEKTTFNYLQLSTHVCLLRYPECLRKPILETILGLYSSIHLLFLTWKGSTHVYWHLKTQTNPRQKTCKLKKLKEY